MVRWDAFFPRGERFSSSQPTPRCDICFGKARSFPSVVNTFDGRLLAERVAELARVVLDPTARVVPADSGPGINPATPRDSKMSLTACVDADRQDFRHPKSGSGGCHPTSGCATDLHHLTCDSSIARNAAEAGGLWRLFPCVSAAVRQVRSGRLLDRLEEGGQFVGDGLRFEHRRKVPEARQLPDLRPGDVLGDELRRIGEPSAESGLLAP